MKGHRSPRILSVVIFSIGALLGVVLIGITVWPDFEAILFDPGLQEDTRLRTLRCPVVMTAKETGTIRARVKNSLDRPTDLFVRAHISHGYVTLMREVNTELSLDAGETEWVTWEINKDDAAFGSLILFRATVSGGYPLPTRQGTCGVLVIDAPYLSGGQIYALTLALSLLGMVAGGALWIVNNPHMLGIRVQLTRAMVFLAVSIVLGILVSFMGSWVLGGLFLIVILLAIGVIIGYFVNANNST
jgi:hypothetical protein